MKYASVDRCPVYSGKVKSFDVIANNTWSVQQGRQRLKIEWDYGPNAGHNSAAYSAELEATAKEPGKVMRNLGDIDGALASAAKRVSADYFVPHLRLAGSTSSPLTIRQKKDRARGQIKVVATNICGSDQHVVRGRTTASAGMVLSHEITAEIFDIGGDVEYIRIRDLVSAPFNVACARCRTCREGNTGVSLNVNRERAATHGYVDMA
jgi:hypothetical protein